MENIKSINKETTTDLSDFNSGRLETKGKTIFGRSVKYYENRDESWLKFNDRIITMAENKDIPLLERINFLSISSSNLDEFTMVRLPNILKNKDNQEPIKTAPLTITNKIYSMITKQTLLMNSLLETLRDERILNLIDDKTVLSENTNNIVRNIFINEVLPLLTPLIVDKVRPFPLINNNTIYIGTIIKNDKDEKVFGIVQVPSDIDRLIKIPLNSNNQTPVYILLEDLIKRNLNIIFSKKCIVKTCKFRVLRNTNYSVGHVQKVFIADEMKEVLKRNKANDVIRLDICGNKKDFSNILCKALKIKKKCVNKVEEDIIDLSFGFSLRDIKLSKEQKINLLYPKFKSKLGIKLSDESNIFNKISNESFILHHPYDSYETVIDFIKQASKDKNVVAIKQTLYRVTESSPIVKALIKAAENGKKVTVLLEVRARFDEVNNLKWANKLEQAGCYVVYGVPNMKTHCKMCLVIRKEFKNTYKKYCHICTGNYSEKNAKLYTDISLFTCNKQITDDLMNLFNYITGYSEPELKSVLYSPVNLKNELIKLINNEIKAKKEGKDAGITLKVNTLTNKEIIDALYKAKDAGVEINLIVRSACSIKNTEGFNIKSILGRFLEHSRIYHFKSSDKFYISSADMMNRNLNNRVEIAVPIYTSDLKNKIKEILDVYLNDNSCFIKKNDHYELLKGDDNSSSQFVFMNKELNKNIDDNVKDNLIIRNNNEK